MTAPSPEMPKLQAALRTPRAAGIAGIVFAVLFAVVVTLVRVVIPEDLNDAGTWVTSEDQRQKVILALDLLPFAGIAFLWFIGVVRDRLGDREDRFFATVFLGSGLLFIAMIFGAGAGLASLLATAGSNQLSSELWRFGRYLSVSMMNVYALRMAAVFTAATTTLAGRLGLVPSWLTLLGYFTALVLMVTVGFIPWIELLFPFWVLVLSVHILVATFRAGAPDSDA